MVADGRTKKVRPLLDRGGLMNPRCHPDLSLILRVTARPAAAYLPANGVQMRGSGAMFPRVPDRIPPSAALLTHPARYSFHQSHCSYYTQTGQGLSRENAAQGSLFPQAQKNSPKALKALIIPLASVTCRRQTVNRKLTTCASVFARFCSAKSLPYTNERPGGRRSRREALAPTSESQCLHWPSVASAELAQ